MTEWNPSNPFDLRGVWENLGVPSPLPGTSPEGYSLPKLPILPTLDLCKSPEAKKARISLKSRFGSPTKSFATYQLEVILNGLD